MQEKAKASTSTVKETTETNVEPTVAASAIKADLIEVEGEISTLKCIGFTYLGKWAALTLSNAGGNIKAIIGTADVHPMDKLMIVRGMIVDVEYTGSKTVTNTSGRTRTYPSVLIDNMYMPD